MEWKVEEEVSEPVSPTGQYFNSSVISVSVLAVLESQVPINDSSTIPLLTNLFLPINSRFSSIMVQDKNGVKIWKKVEVNLKDHINVPNFVPSQNPEKLYDEQFNNYITKISMEELPQSRPLWDIHVIKYPTTKAAGCLIFKLHHALGDGFSLMGALLSCLQRADNPSLPITFPTLKMNLNPEYDDRNIFNAVPRVLSAIFNTLSDFGWSLLKSSVVEDDRTPIRSGEDGVEHRPIAITTMDFSLNHLKQIKSHLQVTINDVITGIIFFGTRLYMQEMGKEFGKSNSTALVLLNTRNVNGYKSVEEMVKPVVDSKWGNQFGFLHVCVPDLEEAETSNPINLVYKAQEIIKKKRNSAAVFLTGRLLETLRKYLGAERTAKHIHTTLKNASMTVSNLIGPVEQLALDNHPCSGMYFMVVGVPQSLTITMISYMGKLTVAVGAEKAYINLDKYNSCINKAFDIIFEASSQPSLQIGASEDIPRP